MDFFYRNNLNKIDFMSSLQVCKENKNWSVLQFGFPSLSYDLQTNQITLLFSNFERKKEYFRQDLHNYALTPSEDKTCLLIESQIDYNDFAISFNSPQSQQAFLGIFQEMLTQSDFNRI